MGKWLEQESSRVLIVSPYFPPSTVAGVHRSRILAKYLPACGWRGVVFCVHESYHEQMLDAELASLVPANTEIVKTRAWPTKLCRFFGVGDLGLRGYSSLKRALYRHIEANKPAVLMFTILPGYPLLMIPRLVREFGVPVLIDYQDPWGAGSGREIRPLSKEWISHKLAQRIEGRVFDLAAGITSVSSGTNDLLKARYPDYPEDRYDVIPIGTDADDFDLVRSRRRPCPWLEDARNSIRISYVGNVWPGARRVVAALLAAVRQLRVMDADLYSRLKLTFIGTSNLPGQDVDDFRVLPAARQAGVDALVMEYPGRIPYLDAVNVMLRSDILLVFGSEDPHYTSSKIFPVLLAGKPVLAIVNAASSTAQIARSAAGVRLVTFDEEHPVERRIPDVAHAIQSLITHPDPPTDRNREVVQPYLGPAIADRFARVFHRITR